MPMGCVSIPFRRLPHQPKLFVRLIDDYSSVKRFYAHPPNMEAVKQVASVLDYPAERRREVARILRFSWRRSLAKRAFRPCPFFGWPPRITISTKCAM